MTNSGFKSSEVEALLCMTKQRVMSLSQDSDNKHKATVVSSFAQDGGVSSSSHASTALCNGRLYADVAKGCACGSNIDKHSEPNTKPRIVNSAYDHSKNVMHEDTCVTARDNDNMKVFDINRLDNKYFSSILIKSSHEGRSVPACNVITHELWKSQTDFNFGFIPLSDFCLSDSTEINNMENYCPITAHKIVKQYNKPNYLGARLKVDSQLNLDEWKKELVGYWDSQLIDLLCFGFPLDFNWGSPLQWEGSNHKSAIEYPGDINAYLIEELQFKAIVGPFDHHPCPGGHISPFLTREKPNSENRRVIVDLSWPFGQSVNAGIDKTPYLGTYFLLTLPTIDHITDQLKFLGKG